MENNGAIQIIENVKKIKEAVDVTGKVTLQEDIFINVFLPVFAGNESLYGVTLKDWTERFGVFNSVTVINKANEELFTVPPFMDNTIVKPRKEGEDRIADIIEGALKRSYIHPVQGERYINTKFNEVFSRLIQSENGLSHLRTWNTIFTRYGFDPVLKEGQLNNGDQQALSSLDVIGYDPL